MGFQSEYNRPPSIMLAVISLIAGFLSCLPGVCLIAIICGALARRYSWADPQRYGGYGMGTIGMSLGGIFLALWLISGGVFLVKAQHAAQEVLRLAEQKRLIQQEIDARVTDRDQAQKIALAARAYALSDKSRKFPPRMAALLAGGLDPATLMSAMSKDLPYTPPSGVEWTLYADDIDKASDFIYVGTGLPRDLPPTSEPPMVVYSKSIHGDGRAVGFADGKSQWIGNSQFQNLIDATNAVRAKQGLAALTPDNPTSDGRPRTVAGNPGNPGAASNSNVPPAVVEKPHTTFDTLDEALTYASDGKPEERKAALTFIERGPADVAAHDKVLAKLEPLYADGTYHNAAYRALKTWATKWDLPMLRTSFESMVKENASGVDPADACVLIDLLTKFEDHQATNPLVRCLHNESLRENASAALKAQGPDAEDAVQAIITDPDGPTAVAALHVLAKVGTAKSVLPLHKIMGSKTADVAPAAQDALKQIAEREKLKPEEYQFVLFNHFSVTPPMGFLEDKGTKANFKQWSRQAPGRAVKSVFAVEVKAVDKGFKLTPPADSAGTLENNGLTFYQLGAGGTNIVKTVHWAALDGDFLIEINASLDVADNNAANNMQKAVQAIKLK